jgi:hypothetical protein
VAARRQRKNESPSVVGAGAAGGGMGTIVAAVANALPESSVWKSVLVVSSPLIAVGISGLCLFAKVVYLDPYANGRKHRAADNAMDKVLADARANAARVLADPNASIEHKVEVRRIVEELERLRLKKITERMEVVAVE